MVLFAAIDRRRRGLFDVLERTLDVRPDLSSAHPS
jgi:hypothetical protein